MTGRVESESGFIPPLSILRGREEKASYLHQELSIYRGNPLTEATPGPWTSEQVIKALGYYPDYSAEECDLPNHLRVHLLDTINDLFIPQGTHLDIEIKISRVLRAGLRRRNPLTSGYWRDEGKRIEALKAAIKSGALERPPHQARAKGFAIIGIGGVGKSTTVEKILLQYLQVIVHTRYKDVDLILKHLVWLKLDCPLDGSPKGFCLNFFHAVDSILGTNYYGRYAKRNRTLDDLLPDLARVASLHCLGLFVIDEIENLSQAKSGGAAKLINFLVHLENAIGVPFLLIGTPDAIPILSGTFRLARRASEQGNVYWKRMPKLAEKEKPDDTDKASTLWEQFIRKLFVYQYVKKRYSLNPDLAKDKVSDALWEASQGIPALVITIFILSQQRAITTGKEEITPNIIKSVVKDDQSLIRDWIEDLKLNRVSKTRGKTASDLDFPYFDDVVTPPPTSAVRKGSDSQNARRPGGTTQAPSETAGDLTRPPETNGENAPTSPGKTSTRNGKGGKTKKPSALEFEPGDLRSILANKPSDQSAGDAFKEAGVTTSGRRSDAGRHRK
jgi:hypothetical protein